MRAAKRWLAAGMIIAAAATGGVWIADSTTESQSARGRNEIAATGRVQGDLYPGDPHAEAQLVQVEEDRIAYVREIAAGAQWEIESIIGPFHVPVGDRLTLVLPARDEPYGLADLLELAPENVMLQGDGSYLLTESILALDGATLDLRSDAGLVLRLDSGPNGFVSIVSVGGRLDIAGTDAAPVVVSSWDSTAGAPDVATSDGRAYVRVIDGSTSVVNAELSDLGFWSGGTGGFALTGSEREIPAQVPVVEPQQTAGAPVLLPSELETLALDASDSSVGHSTGEFANVTALRNAFGLFVSNATGVVVRDATIMDSLVDGVVLHRFVTESTITDTVATGNNVDGFSLSRSSASNTLDRVTAEANGRNGISIDGQPLADGPSAAGTPVESFGNNRVTSATVIDNARYGVEISGGFDVVVSESTISGNQSGVVIDQNAARVDISHNRFTAHETQSVAVREGVTGAVISSNTISGGETGVYVRGAEAAISHNTITEAANHGISLVFQPEGSLVESNVIAGTGPSAIYQDIPEGEDAAGVATIGENNLDDWVPTPTVESVARSVFQPLTVVWLVLAVILLVTAVRGSNRKRKALPYEERVPLTSLSRGVVSPDSIRSSS